MQSRSMCTQTTPTTPPRNKHSGIMCSSSSSRSSSISTGHQRPQRLTGQRQQSVTGTMSSITSSPSANGHRRFKGLTSSSSATHGKSSSSSRSFSMSSVHRSWSLCHIFTALLLVAGLTVRPCSGQQQRFRTTPHDLQVLERSEALLRCEVSNLGGQVQWTKDGFALGFLAVIPGFPRYSVLGDQVQGVYNLKISNASLEDDAEYQCQVGPAKLNSAIRANAKLTVISPPSSIEIVGHQHNAKVEVRENQDLTLTCIVANAKPAAQIQWYRKNVEYKPENREEKTVDSHGKRFTTTSRLRLTPTADDDYTDYSCQAKHKALQPDMPMRATVQLSVLYPPGAPYIEGYTPGETLRRGQAVELACRSRGGNPPAQLIWYKNGVQVRMAYRTNARMSENIYTFTAEANDNKARFRCEASNIMSQTPLKTEVDVTVMFAPAHVTINGPSEARENEAVPLQCTTAPSNPPADIKWVVNGRHIRNTTSRTVVSAEGGWITTSNLTVNVEPGKRSLVAICHGINTQLTENIVSTRTVNVLYPPSQPLITGYTEGSIIQAGSVQKMLCVSSGGNPLATLSWFKNDKKINSAMKTSDKTVSAELAILANVTDNQARYRCEAHNSATEIPLFETTTLSVHFAPENVKIRIDPDELVPGIEAVLTCDSSSSNPPATISWWKNGIPVDGTSNETSKTGLWGGTVSSLDLKVNVTQAMDGEVYTCQSNNEALQRSVHEAVSLKVLYPPQFVPAPSSTVVGVEGEPLQVAMRANANPMSIAYTWTKDGVHIVPPAADRIVSEGPILNITRLERSDAGIYTCEAVNSQGSETINITVIVEYGATITSISENIVVSPGDEATLSCSVEGKPLTEDHVRWERLGYDIEAPKAVVTFANGTSFLHVKDAQRADVGNFRCVADNRVANPTSRDVLLIVKFAPEIDKSFLRAASGAGERARLPCRAQAAPQPLFQWTRAGQALNVNKTWKFTAETKQIDALTYESTLIMEKVAPADYGLYECTVSNDLGESKENVRLDITSKPDMPISLNVLNTTHDSVTIAWTPGFDGGMKASYRVRYREAHSDHYKYEDGLPNSHKLTVTGLRTNTLHLFSVMASNQLGSSSYMPDLTKAHTKEAPVPASRPASSLGGGPITTTSSTTPVGTRLGVLLLVGGASGTTLVLLNIVLIGCCLHKRHQNRLKRAMASGIGPEALPSEILEKSEMPTLVIVGIAMAALGLLVANAALVAWFVVRKRNKEASNQNSKSATIEMYAPSSYNDTVTGETLSSVSEKSDTYSNDGNEADYMDETRKKAASTYLVENSDIPPPRYQKDGTLPVHYPMGNNAVNSAHIKTLPHPRHHAASHMLDARARDDQMIGKGSGNGYMPSPSPAPPMDGSYYNMNSDRYLSYPPMDYPSALDYSTPPPLPMAHMVPTVHSAALANGVNSGTLRRGVRGMVPPPDVTHHTNHSKSTHDLHHNSPGSVGVQTMGGGGGQMMMNNLSGGGPKLPQGILKDPNRKVAHPNMQILNVSNAPGGLGGSLMPGGFDPSSHNLSSFNASMGYTDADGHLV